MKKNLIVAFLLNLVIFILEVIGLIVSIQKNNLLTFTFYTTDSNILALFSSSLFCIFYIINSRKITPIPKWISVLRFISCSCLGVTMFISICVIIPLYPNLFKFMLFENFGLYHHLICPVLSIVSFLFFEKSKPLQKSSILITLIPTIAYGLINISLNFLKIIIGPYPFLYLFVVPWYTSVFSVFFILSSAIIIATFLYKIYNKKAVMQK